MMISKLTIFFAACAAASAGTIYPTPTGLAPGTQYQLVFVTSGAFDADDSNIADYNSDVAAQAALNTTLAAFDSLYGVTWTVVGSTTAVNANANSPSSGLVYTLNNVKVAAAGIYGGSLLAPIDIDENGNVSNTYVWSGSVSAGTVAGGINDLGQTFPEYGLSSSTTGTFLQDGNGTEGDNGMVLYAISSVITVPQISAVPEPGTLPMAALAIGLLGLARHFWTRMTAKSA